MHNDLLIIFFFTSVILNLGLALYGWRHREIQGAVAFSLAMFLFAILPLSQAINIASSELLIKVAALKSRVEVGGIGAIAWLVMVMQFTGYSHLVNRRILTVLSLIPLIIFILNWTENPLFRSRYHMEVLGDSSVLHWTNGPTFWLGLLYLNALLLTPLYLLWQSYRRISPLSFQQTLALSVSTVLPLMINLLSQVGFPPVQGINFPFAAGPLMGLIVALAIFRYRIFDVAPFARGLLIESMSDGVLVLDTQNRIVDINPAMQKLIGPAEVGQNAETVLAAWPDLVGHFRDISEAETEIVVNGDTPRYFDLRISPLSEKPGNLRGRLIVVRDITKYEQIEAALRASENNFRQMLASAPDAILIVDQAGTLTLVNDQCEKIFGYPKPELLGQSVEMLLPENLREIHKTHRAAYFRDPQARPMGALSKWKLMAVRKDGMEFPVEISLSPLEAESGLLTIAAVRDTTERKHAEEAIRRQSNYLSALHNITLDLLNRRDVNDLLQAIVDRASEFLEAPFVELLLVENDELVVRAFTSNQSFLAGERVKRGEANLSWRAFDTRQPAIVNDYAHWPLRREVYDGQHLSAVAALPILFGERCIGVLDLSRSKAGHNFDESEIQAGTLLAQLAALVVDNTKLFTNAIRQSQELSLLQDVRTAIAREYDVSRIAKRTVEAINETFGYALVGLYLLEDDTLILQHQIGYEQAITMIPITKGVSGRVVRTGQPVLLEDVRSDPSFLEAIEGIVSEVAVPIFDEGRAVGILNIESRYGVKLTEADLRLMLDVSDQVSVAMSRARLYENLSHNNERLSSLHRIAIDVLNQRNLDDLLQNITDQAVSVVDAAVGYIALAEGERLVVRAVSPRDFPRQDQEVAIGGDDSPAWQVFESHQAFVTEDFSSLPGIGSQRLPQGVKATILFPIMAGENCLGILGTGRMRPGYLFTEEDVKFGNLFARLAAVALDNVQLHHALLQESIRDPLTGLFNRRFMEEALSKELKRAHRNVGQLAVVMLDLDHFKNINDTFGHDTGDEALRQFSALLQVKVRESDIVCRYGGEEFTLILPNAHLSDALHRMEQLRKDIKQLEIRHQGKSLPQFTASFGIAIYPEHGSTGEALLKAADEALYRAKQSGRDRVLTA